MDVRGALRVVLPPLRPCTCARFWTKPVLDATKESGVCRRPRVAASVPERRPKVQQRRLARRGEDDGDDYATLQKGRLCESPVNRRRREAEVAGTRQTPIISVTLVVTQL